MNSTNLSKFVFIVNEDFFLRIGSTWIIDSVYLAVISPIGFIGFLLNLLCFFVLLKIKIKETNVYEYLKIYSLNSSLICLTFGFLFLSHSPRYFNDFNNYYVKIFKCRIFGYGTISLYFFNNLLDILIILDRISIFKANLRLLCLNKPYILCSTLFIACFAINLCYFFSTDIASDETFFQSDSTSYCEQNAFIKTRAGFMLNLFVIILRDIVTLILEIIFSILLIYYYDRFKKMSINILGRDTQNQSLNDVNVLNRIIFELNFRKREKRQQLLIMTIILSIFSFVTHIIVAVVFVFLVLVIFIFQNRLIFFSLVTFGCFIMVSKHFLTIFIFYFFNVNFKKKFDESFFKRR